MALYDDYYGGSDSTDYLGGGSNYDTLGGGGFGGLGGFGQGMNNFLTNPLVLASLKMISNNSPQINKIPNTFDGVAETLFQSGTARQKQIERERALAKEQADKAQAEQGLTDYFAKLQDQGQKITEPPRPVEAPAIPDAPQQSSTPASNPNMDALATLAKANSDLGDNRYAGLSALEQSPPAAPERALPQIKTSEEADKFVAGVNPNLPDGVRSALSNLTIHAGADWAATPLGEAIKAGDYAKAKELLPAYAAQLEQKQQQAQPRTAPQEQEPLPKREVAEPLAPGGWLSGLQQQAPAPQIKTEAAAATYAQNRAVPAPAPQPTSAPPAQTTPSAPPAQSAPTVTDQALVAHAANPRADPRSLARILNNPQVNAGVKSAILQDQLSKYQLQTLPDGTIVRIDAKRGTVDEIYKGASKDKWEFKKIGSDMSGDKMAWVNERTKQIEEYNPKGGGDNSLDAVATKIDKAKASGITDPEKLADQIPDRGTAAYTKALLRGDAIPSNLGNRAGAIRANAIQMAHIIDPNFREEQITMRQTFARNMASSAPNSVGSQIRSSATVVEHLGSGLDNLDVVAKGAKGVPLGEYGEQPELNRARSMVNRRANDKNYNNALGGYEVDSRAVSGEIVRLLTGGQGSEKDRKEWQDRFDLSKRSLSEVRGAWNEAYNIMYGRLSSVAAQKEAAWGEPVDPVDLLPKESRAIIKRVREGAASGTKGYSPDDVEAEIRRRGLK